MNTNDLIALIVFCLTTLADVIIMIIVNTVERPPKIQIYHVILLCISLAWLALPRAYCVGLQVR